MSFLETNSFLPFQDLTSSNICMHEPLTSLICAYTNGTVLSRIKVPQFYAGCAQLYSTRAIGRALDIVQIPKNGEECLLRRGDHRFTTALIIPQHVEYQSARSLG